MVDSIYCFFEDSIKGNLIKFWKLLWKKFWMDFLRKLFMNGWYETRGLFYWHVVFKLPNPFLGIWSIILFAEQYRRNNSCTIEIKKRVNMDWLQNILYKLKNINKNKKYRQFLSFKKNWITDQLSESLSTVTSFRCLHCVQLWLSFQGRCNVFSFGCEAAIQILDKLS